MRPVRFCPPHPPPLCCCMYISTASDSCEVFLRVKVGGRFFYFQLCYTPCPRTNAVVPRLEPSALNSSVRRNNDRTFACVVNAMGIATTLFEQSGYHTKGGATARGPTHTAEYSSISAQFRVDTRATFFSLSLYFWTISCNHVPVAVTDESRHRYLVKDWTIARPQRLYSKRMWHAPTHPPPPPRRGSRHGAAPLFFLFVWVSGKRQSVYVDAEAWTGKTMHHL